MFDILTRANRSAVLHRSESVQRPETRARHIAAFVEMLGRARPCTRSGEAESNDAGHGSGSGSPSRPSGWALTNAFVCS